jgi:hypothetical protein
MNTKKSAIAQTKNEPLKKFNGKHSDAGVKLHDSPTIQKNSKQLTNYGENTQLTNYGENQPFGDFLVSFQFSP